MAGKYAADVHDQVLALVNTFPPDVMRFLDNAIPWHVGATDDDKDGLDMICWVEDNPPKEILLHMSHVKMETDEPTIEKELEFVPLGIDYFGPKIMEAIRGLMEK